MRTVVEWCPSHGWARAVCSGLLAAGLAGCSAESTRFGDNPFSNPYASPNRRGSPEVTGSIRPAPVGRVEQRPLQYGTLPPPNASRPGTVSSSGQVGGGRGMASYSPAYTSASYAPPSASYTPPSVNYAPPKASYAPPSASYTPSKASHAPPSGPLPAPAKPVASDITGTVSQSAPQPLPPPPPRGASQAGWNWDGGTAVVVGPGENVDMLSRRYGVPSSAILQANGLSSPAAIQSGHRIVIPRYNATQARGTSVAAVPPATAPVAPASAVARPMVSAATAPVPVARPAAAPPPAVVAATTPRGRAPTVPPTTAGGSIHVVAPGETLIRIAKRYRKPLTEVAAANRIPPHAMVKMGDRIVIPGKVVVGPAPAVKPVATAAPAVAPPRTQPPARAVQAQPAPAPSGPQIAAAGTPAVRVATPTAPADDDDEAAPVGSTGGAPAFRWPVRGRIIAGFGAKPSGQQNDGINLAVPEGTAVRAAEDGVVAYAGNELKGYGNLILVRHANGFVTAYAHASELMVKRNDQVRRGQVIAKSGQSGTVTSPQLHFEIRKGSNPVDPTQYLPAG